MLIVNPIEVVVREIPSDEQMLFESLGEDERAYAEALTAARRREWVAWRALLRERAERWGVGEQALRVAYSASGEPQFEGLKGAISVTHSRRFVALARSWSGRCGIDIEQLNRNYERIENKYISDTERQLPTADDERFRAAVWCAKEAMFKCVGREGVDFRSDLRITEVDFERGEVSGTAFGEPIGGVIEQLDGALLVAVSRDPDQTFIITE